MEGLSGVKAVIKSMVLSYNNTLTVDKLGRLYMSSEGEYIPHKRFGYNNLELFLKSMPDAVLVVGYGPNALVRPVSSEKTKHLEDMISKQKKKPLSKRCSVRSFPSQKPRYTQPTGYSQPQINIYNQQSHFKGCGYNVNGFQYQNQVNPIAMQNLQFLQNNMYVNQLHGQFLPCNLYYPQPYYNNNYRKGCAGNIPTQVLKNYNQQGQKQNFMYQVPPLPKFPLNIPPPPYQVPNPNVFPQQYQAEQTVQSNPDPMVSENLITLGESAKGAPPVEEDNYSYPLFSYLKSDFVRPTDEEMTKALKAMLIKEPTVQNEPPPLVLPENKVPEPEIKEPSELLFLEPEVEGENQHIVTDFNERNIESEALESDDELPPLVKSDTHRDEDDFMSLDGNARDSQYFSQRNEDDEDIYGSATSLLSVCSTTSVSSRSQRHHMLTRLLKDFEKENLSLSKPKMTRADLMTVEKIEPSKETVDKLSKNNILRENILTKPKSRVKLIELAAQEVRAQNKLVRFAENKEEIRKIQKITKIRSMMKECTADLQSISEEKKKSEDEEIDESELALPATLDIDFLCRMDIPDNVLKTGQELPSQVFPDFVKIGKYVPVFITEVNSPFKFWFHIRKDDDDLDLLMNTME
ncbi:TDRD5.2 family protein [Megaselia abdita]